MQWVWDVTSRVGLHPVTWLGAVYSDTVFRARGPGVQGTVALTIDDGICRHNIDRSLLEEVRAMLRERGATATFMLCSDYLSGHEGAMRQMIEEGHEFGNHCPKDWGGYASLASEEFEEQLLETQTAIEGIVGAEVKWFRAPQGKYTASMRKSCQKLGLRHALGDCYCDDYAITDSEWVAATLLRQVQSGSIIILHMPERGYREHVFRALALLLEGLERRNFRAVTLSSLMDLSDD
uniref:NodB homology domain-containing protein n=1 Tax=Noctiluca scintillans TaxID=2966 RepID=A0A7S0ZXU6_NOCSC